MEKNTAVPPAEPSAAGTGPRFFSRRPVRLLLWGLLGLYFLAGALFLFVREALLPRVDEYRPQIAAALNRATGLQVGIERLQANWSGLRPDLQLQGLTLRDELGQSALHLPRVDATLALSSLWRGQAYFYRLQVFRPELTVRRQADGRVLVGGFDLSDGGDTSADEAKKTANGFTAWLSGQHEIAIRDATLIWSDRMRDAPDLRLEQVNLLLSSPGPDGATHYLGMQALPPTGLANGLDGRGELHGQRIRLYAGLTEADLGAWRQWVDYPAALTGRGNVQLWSEISGDNVESLEARLALRDVSLRLSDTLPELALSHAGGVVGMRRTATGMELTLHELTLSGDGIEVAPLDVTMTLKESAGDYGDEGTLSVESVELAELAKLATHAPLEDSIREQLLTSVPRGRLEKLSASWQGGWQKPEGWQVKTVFSGLGANAYQHWPGIDNLSGEFEGGWLQGRYRLDSRDAALDLPGVLPESVIALTRLQANGQWQRRDGRLEVILDAAEFSNADAAGEASGRYSTAFDDPGEIDISARITRADAVAVWRYMPWAVNETARHWLQNGLKGGYSDNAQLQLRGALRDFPFDDGEDGQFLVTVQVHDGVLHYADGWPDIDSIRGELRFEKSGMHIDGEYGRIFDVDLRNVVVEIPEFDAPEGQLLTVRGQASGPTGSFLRYIDESPVIEQIGGFTSGLQAAGNGSLTLALDIPLHNVEKAGINGDFRFDGNRVTVLEGLPAVEKASGQVAFTETALTIPQISGNFLGAPLRVSAATKGDIVTFRASGTADLPPLQKAYTWPALSQLSGRSPWQTEIRVHKKSDVTVTVDSDLRGIESTLPAPLNKRADENWPLHVELQFTQGGTYQQIRATLAERASVQLAGRQKDGEWRIEGGGVAIGMPLKPSAQGVMLSAKFDELDIDEWRNLLAPPEDAAENRHGNPQTTGLDAASVLTGLDIQAQRVSVSGWKATQVEFAALADSGGWKGRIASDQAAGVFDWREDGKGLLTAHFKSLIVGDGEREKSAAAEEDKSMEDEDAAGLERMPALNLKVDQLLLYGMDLGSLSLQAENRRRTWVLDAFELRNTHAVLNGSGQWRAGRKSSSEFKFNLETDDIGKLLKRVGYPSIVKGGQAGLTGNIGWKGSPVDMHLPSLDGQLTLQAKNGQFSKLEPGVGRLLGVLSLQSLPRRLTLDFQDVFSEGFSFDNISGDISLNRGVLYSRNLHIAGPAANVWIEGTANAVEETQSLQVFVQPTLSESIAIGAAAGLINPVAGVVTYIAQKALSDPVEKIFAFGYAVTGSWADPQVRKLAGGDAKPGSKTRKTPERENDPFK